MQNVSYAIFQLALLSNLSQNNPMVIYVAEKTLTERAVWEFVDEHPHLEMMTGEYKKTQVMIYLALKTS